MIVAAAFLVPSSTLAAPPDGVDLTDLTKYETGSHELLAGPTGCWALGGKVSITVAGFTAATRIGRGERRDDNVVGTFDGLLVDGVWTNLSYALHPADAPDEAATLDVPVLPTVGRVERSGLHRTNPPAERNEAAISVSDGEGEAFNIVERTLASLGSTATSYVEWDDRAGAAVLYQDVPMSDASRSDVVTVRTVFPSGGPATTLDATFPRRIRQSQGLFRVSVYDLQIHLRARPAEGVLFPARDNVSFGLSAIGFTFGYEQELVYERASRCVPVGPPAPSTPPPAPAP